MGNKLRRQPLVLLSCAALAVVSVACAGSKSPQVELRKSVQLYHQHMRWNRYEQASLYLLPKDRGEFLGRYEELGDDYKVIEFEIKSMKLAPDGNTAESVAIISWMQEPNMTVHKDKVTAMWRLVEGEHWVIEERVVEAKK